MLSLDHEGPGLDERHAAARARLTSLAGKPKAGLESGRPTEPDLSETRVRTSLEMFQSALIQNVVKNPATPLGREEADAVTGLAESGLRKLATEGEEADLTPPEQSALEAVVATDGSRPSLLIQDGFVVADAARIGGWADELAMGEAAIRRAIASTGRLLVNGNLAENSVYGTAWMVAPGLAATAQHVVEGLFSKVGDQWVPRFGFDITLDFAVEANRPANPESRKKVRGVKKPSPDTINNTLDLANLDAAILELEEEGPPPFILAAALEAIGSPPQIHVVGHPFRPQVTDAPDIPPDAATRMTRQVLELVFGDAFGVKRWSPGMIVVGPGTLDGDIHGRVMTHDASTLGGNSGSPIFDLNDFPDRVVGLHYGGFFRRENYAHPAGEIRAQLEVPGAVFV